MQAKEGGQKTMKKITTFALAVTLIVTMWIGNSISSQAGCSGWTEIDSTVGTTCDYSKDCGFLWLNTGTKYRTGTKERWCDEGGSQVRKTTSFCDKIGCCE